MTRMVLAAFGFTFWPMEVWADVAQKAEKTVTPASRLGNRKVPVVSPPPAVPRFSATPTDQELFKARVFEEPFVPEGQGNPAENTALAKALTAYLGTRRADDLSALEGFLAQNPDSAWRVSLLTNLAVVSRRTGHFSKALEFGQAAWREGKDSADLRTQALAGRGLAELADLWARLGRLEELKGLLAEVEGRSFSGSVSEKLDQARQGVWMMENRAEATYRCGPLAVQNLLRLIKGIEDPRVAEAPTTAQGTSLLQMTQLANEVGLKMRMAKRERPETQILVPSMVHWRVGHFAALLEKQGERYLLQDPTFGAEMWVSRDAIEAEADGYFMVAGERLPEGWREVGDEEGASVFGKGAPPGQNAAAAGCGASQKGGGGPICCSRRPMARYSFYEMLAALAISDTPVGYAPPLGSAVQFSVMYNQRESFQPAIFSYSNVGSMWTFDWLSYLTDDPFNPAQTVDIYERGGGVHTYAGYNPATQTYAPNYETRDVVVRVSDSPIKYERRGNDGSIETYAQPDGALAAPRRVFLTELKDPQGNKRSFVYDADLRLVAVVDPLGQVTTLLYELAEDPLKITKVVDPFGRSGVLEYDSSGRLSKITDAIGLTSEFTYDSTNLITALKTPYGTTTFAAGQIGADRWIEATDPLGAKERLEYVNGHAPAIHPQIDPDGAPTGFNNAHLDSAMSFFWSKSAMARAPGDYTQAEVTHWMWMPNTAQASGIVRATRKPLERRVWYQYPGAAGVWLGGDARPTAVARLLDDGSTQEWQYQQNTRGKTIKTIDPLGRETVYVYGVNNIPDADPATGEGLDLLQVKQKNGASYDLLQSYTYNDKHQVLTATDAAGQTTTYTYNPKGQILTVETPARAGITEDRTTTYTYNSSGYLLTVTGPATGATTTYTYDAAGRMRTVTNSDNYTITYDYDALDRPVKSTYPDGTTEVTTYNKLQMESTKDRMGRVTRYVTDALGQTVSVRDPAGRTTQQEWGGTSGCACGGCDRGGSQMTRLIDAKGNETRWEYDIQGRVTKEIRANGAAYEYTYENTTSRLKTAKDPKGNIKTYSYNLDDSLAGIVYTEAAGTANTPDVSFTYDPMYSRLATMTDGAGTTQYAYYPATVPPALGTGQLHSVDGPLSNDTIEYGYDELGRVTQRQIGSSANTQTQAFDNLGRLTTLTNPLGAFTYAYDGVTGRVTSLSYPNGQQTTYAYFDNTGDRRLQEIHNKKPGGATLSKFNYTYDKVGNILTWTQQADTNPARVYEFGYDNADQLTAAILKSTDPTPQILKRYFYAYDAAANRTAEQIDDAVTAASYNNMNQLVSQAAGGALTFSGTVSEPATVSVGGQPANVTADNRFQGQAAVPGGTGNVQVVATDPSGNTRTNTYQVTQTGAGTTFTYDANGNMTGDGIRTFEWDAENRLTAVKQGATTLASHTYNSAGIRTSKTTSGVTTTYMLEGSSVVEERLSTGAGTKHFQGPNIDHVLAFQETSGTVTQFTRDHLGSFREQSNSNGTEILRRDYDPWGNLLEGQNAGGWAFTGREWDPEIGLYYYRSRYYSAELGRFISGDPIGFRAGPNFYSYVGNNPLRWIDPLGFGAVAPTPKPPPTPKPSPSPGPGPTPWPPTTLKPPAPPPDRTDCYFRCMFDFGPGLGTLGLIFLCVPAGVATAEAGGLLGGGCAVVIALYCDWICEHCEESPHQPHGGEAEPAEVGPPQPYRPPPVHK